jgi:hypothetical protein
MTKWKELQQDHPAIEPRPVSTMEKSALAGNEECSALTDMVNHPAHYQGEIECIDAIEASMSKEAFAGHCKACAIKYLWRYQQKGGVESLQKAQWYLARLISTEKNAL